MITEQIPGNEFLVLMSVATLQKILLVANHIPFVKNSGKERNYKSAVNKGISGAPLVLYRVLVDKNHDVTPRASTTWKNHTLVRKYSFILNATLVEHCGERPTL